MNIRPNTSTILTHVIEQNVNHSMRGEALDATEVWTDILSLSTAELVRVTYELAILSGACITTIANGRDPFATLMQFLDPA